MQYRLDYHAVPRLPETELSVIQCGRQVCEGGYASGSRYYPDYSLTFVTEGKGVYNVGGVTHEIAAGQGFAIFPGAPVSYRADDTEPWRYYYAIFRGAGCAALLGDAGLTPDSRVFAFPTDEAMLRDLAAMYEAGRDPSARGYDVNGYFLLAVSRLVRSASDRRKRALGAEGYFEEAVRYIESSFAYGISVESIAARLCIDRTYLYRIFRKQAGISPARYLNEYRLSRAVELLVQPGVSVTEAALSAGFYDLSHFSRYFEAKYHMTPGQYRLRRTAGTPGTEN